MSVSQRVSMSHCLVPSGLSHCPLLTGTVALGWAPTIRENSILGEERREVVASPLTALRSIKWQKSFLNSWYKILLRVRNALFREISLSCLGMKIYAGQRLEREDRIKGAWLFLCIGKLDFFSYKEREGYQVT